MLARRAASMARAAAQLVCYRQDALRLLLLRPAFATMVAYIPLHRARLAACHFAYRCCVIMLRRWRRWRGRRRRDQRAAALAAVRCARVRRGRALAHWQDVVLLPLLTRRVVAEANARRQARGAIAAWRAHACSMRTAAAAAAAARRRLALGRLRGAWSAWGLWACRGRAAAARRARWARRRLRLAWRVWATRRLEAQCWLAARVFARHAFARCRATTALLLWRCAATAVELPIGRTSHPTRASGRPLCPRGHT